MQREVPLGNCVWMRQCEARSAIGRPTKGWHKGGVANKSLHFRADIQAFHTCHPR